jgi:hexosaminidase
MDIIPLPAQILPQIGKHHLKPTTRILTDSANRWNANYLHGLLSTPTTFPLLVRIGDQAVENDIRLYLDPNLDRLGREGYRLEVTPRMILIAAPGTSGVLHGIQTLRQLLPVEVEDRHPVTGVDWSIPCVLIEDRPRFAWRGFMLDEGRHFHGKETVLLTLDLMSLQKINILHWHLTEDQGWRIEIKKYPGLTKIGSKRAGTSKSLLGGQHDGSPVVGYYTQDEVREIVAYATERNITIVPEIEMPGHSLAALASYPNLSCTGGPFDVATHFGIFPDILCAGKESVFTFLQDVLDEILELFPSPVIHIGGDEAPMIRWKRCPDCQRRMREERLKDEHALKVYFTNRIAAYLDSKGRRVIGWNEILQAGLDKSPGVQYWARNLMRLIDSIRTEKRTVIMSNYLDTYLDHGYNLLPLSRAYRFEPIPAELDDNEAGSISGLEFPLWSEWVPNRARLDYQVYPRLTAMAETGWTLKERKDFGSFQHRLPKFLARLDHLGVQYAPQSEIEPSKIKQLFGVFTILQPQNRTKE